MDVLSLLSSLEIPYQEGGSHRHIRQGWVGLPCEWCQTGDKYHLGIPLDNPKVVVCWQCGRHSLTEYLRLATNLSWSECRRLSDSVQPQTKQLDSAAHNRWAKQVQVPSGLGPVVGTYKDYLQRRGFDAAKIISTWDLQATGYLGKYKFRIWIPVYDATGELASWTSRSITDTQTRYLHANPEMERAPIKSLLYGEHLVSSQTVVVVEGPTDVWRIGPGAVAVFGIGWTEAQARKLEKYVKRVILFDSEPRAKAAACRLYQRLSGKFGDTQVLDLEGGDPGQMSAEQVRELRQLVFS